MDRVKEIVSIILGGRLIVEGSGRTFAKAPVWLVALCGVSSIKLTLLTALLVAAFGMTARIVKA